jgi:hypothetical protein
MHFYFFPQDVTRIIQSLYYAPAGRYITSSSESADRGHSIIQVTQNVKFVEDHPMNIHIYSLALIIFVVSGLLLRNYKYD